MVVGLLNPNKTTKKPEKWFFIFKETLFSQLFKEFQKDLGRFPGQ